MIAQIQVRRGTTAEWAAAAPVVLGSGEPGLDTTSGVFKVGDGATAWSVLGSIALQAYPIGSVYTSLTATSPATLFGGTWSAITAGTFLAAAGAGYAAGATGGEATHVLTAAELARHKHKNVGNTTNTAGAALVSKMGTSLAGETTDVIDSADEYSGNDVAHENRPPYYAVYMWRRTA